MRKWCGRVLVVSALFVAGTSLAQETMPADTPPVRAGTAATAADNLQTVFDDAGLSGEELATFDALAKERQSKLKAWDASESGQKLIALRAERTTVRRDTTLSDTDREAKMTQIRETIRTLTNERLALSDSTRGEILKRLTPAQQEKLLNAVINRRVQRQYRDLGLTEEQNQKIQVMVTAAVPEHLKKYPLDKDPRFMATVGTLSSLGKKIRDEVLTESQLTALSAPRTPTTQGAPATQPAAE